MLPKSVQVVIVGGEVASCATAFWLAKAGLPAPILVRDRPGCEASAASAGMVVAHGGDEADPFRPERAI
jgi:glycine/D-amino acid oxidase-like deaminating enzyme